MFNDFNSNNPDSGFSERDRLEIDSDGKKRGTKAQEKRAEKFNNLSSNNQKKGRFSNRNNKNSFNNNNQGSSWLSIILILGVVGVLIYVPISFKSGTLPNPIRALVSGNAQENADNFFNSIQIFKKKGDKVANNKANNTIESILEDSFYDTNPLYEAKYMGGQVDPEYVVMVYTGDDTLDKPFIDWIEKYEKETPKSKRYKIYRINLGIAIDDMYVEEALIDENYNIIEKPLFMIYNTPEKNKKVLDSIIDNPQHLDKFVEYMDGIVKEANENK